VEAQKQFPDLNDPEKSGLLRSAGFLYHPGLELFASPRLRKLAFREAIDVATAQALNGFIARTPDAYVNVEFFGARRDFSKRQLDNILAAIGWSNRHPPHAVAT
jgi:hypothetical protein